MIDSADGLDGTSTLSTATREELYQLARRRGLRVTRRQTRASLLEVLTSERPDDAGAPGEPDHGGDGEPHAASRVEAFTLLARRRAAGEMVLLPRQLVGSDRRIHVRQTIREDHQTRIATHDEEAREKFTKLAASPFMFFRGTALLFYRDMAGEDPWMPTVLSAGDVHPDNFGVVPNRDDVPVFGIDDYDEAAYAPFTWDLKRGATGFMVAAESEGAKGCRSAGHQRSVAEVFVRGYSDAVREYAADSSEAFDELRRDNAPPLVAALLDHAVRGSRAEYLTRKYLDATGRRFAPSKKIVPVTSRLEEFQELVDRYVRENAIEVPPRADGMRVKDVAVRKGQGTASLGLARYYLLVGGDAPDGTDDLLLEVKQARRSALAGLVPPSDISPDDHEDHADPSIGGDDADGGAAARHGARIAHAQRVAMVNGGVFYGSVQHDGDSYLVRERSWYRDGVELGSLSAREWHDYARVCGRVLANLHARSDEAGRVDHDVEPEILSAMAPLDLFVEDVVDFAAEAADRVRADHATYRRDHAHGAFSKVDLVYR